MKIGATVATAAMNSAFTGGSKRKAPTLPGLGVAALPGDVGARPAFTHRGLRRGKFRRLHDSTTFPSTIKRFHGSLRKPLCRAKHFAVLARGLDAQYFGLLSRRNLAPGL